MLRCTAHLVHSPQPLRLNSTILAEYHFTSLSSVHLSTQDLLSHGTLFVETSMNVSVDQVRVPQVKEHICTTWVKCFPLLDLFFHLRHQVLLIPLWTSYMEHWLTEDWGLCSGPSAAWCKWISWCTVRRSLLFRWQGMVLLRYPNQYKVEDRLCKTARTGRIVLLGPCWRSCSPKATWSTWFSCSRLEWFVRWSVGKLLTTFDPFDLEHRVPKKLVRGRDITLLVMLLICNISYGRFGLYWQMTSLLVSREIKLALVRRCGYRFSLWDQVNFNTKRFKSTVKKTRKMNYKTSSVAFKVKSCGG